MDLRRDLFATKDPKLNNIKCAVTTVGNKVKAELKTYSNVVVILISGESYLYAPPGPPEFFRPLEVKKTPNICCDFAP